jgi:putative nucleotidyltransferase with HDIG domain
MFTILLLFNIFQGIFMNFEMVMALSEALDARDKYTAGHSRRVMEYSVGIAKHLKLPGENIALLKISALLHDIGKIGIPDDILHKQSNISDKEFAAIKKHPEIGANILKAVGAFKNLVPIVYHHHERFDGLGYPQGIYGEQIPLYARIISIADSFDAMTSTRPYRKALHIENALLEIELNGGKQFDPSISNVFIDRFGDIFDEVFRNIEPEYSI